MGITATVNADAVIARFTRLPENVKNNLVPTMDRIGFDLVTHVVRDKLSGQVLNRRSGRLSNAITHTPPEVSGGTVSTKVGVFSGVPYARVHEYGGQVHVPEVSGKLMVFTKGGDTVFTMRHAAFTANMPERSYLRSSLDDMRQDILARISQTVKDSE